MNTQTTFTKEASLKDFYGFAEEGKHGEQVMEVFKGGEQVEVDPIKQVLAYELNEAYFCKLREELLKERALKDSLQSSSEPLQDLELKVLGQLTYDNELV